MRYTVAFDIGAVHCWIGSASEGVVWQAHAERISSSLCSRKNEYALVEGVHWTEVSLASLSGYRQVCRVYGRLMWIELCQLLPHLLRIEYGRNANETHLQS